jgi:3-hydroxyisobutyrate dehydrogenase-like beta-hydroxyacid dehydrogenase
MATRAIGFIGLGLMGSAFTQHMLDCGHMVFGYDRVTDKMAEAAANGVSTTNTVAAVANQCEQVHVCVMTSDDLEAVVFGDDGIATANVNGKILVDHSTTPEAITRDYAARLKSECGMDWIDAPVSGGPPAARTGNLAIMAGGEQSVIDRAMPVLSELGTCTHMGNVGAGQVTKMVNQILVLNNYCILAEALALAEAGGVDADKIPAALSQGHAGSNLLQNLFPRLVKRDFEPAGYAFQVLKDLQMVKSLAQSLEVPTPMSSQASALFRELNDNGDGNLDGIAVLKLYKDSLSHG